MEWILGRLEARASDLGPRAFDLGWFLFSSRVTVSFRTFPCAKAFRVCVILSLPASPLSFLLFWWRLGERRKPLGLWASALLSHLSLIRWRLTERRGMTWPSSVPSKSIQDTSKNSLRGKLFQEEVLIYSNFNISGLRDFSDGSDGYK